jgi:hypothetical protein
MKPFARLTGNIQPTLVQLLFSFDRCIPNGEFRFEGNDKWQSRDKSREKIWPASLKVFGR